MGYCCRHHLHLLLVSLMILSSTQVRFMAEGSRTLLKLLEEPLPSHTQPQVMKGIEEMKVMINERVMIGSHPPRCEMKCNTCRHCEAVQVPAVPQNNNQKKKTSTTTTTTTTTTSKVSTAMRGDDNTNYKPMSWKCKCGDMIYNP